MVTLAGTAAAVVLVLTCLWLYVVPVVTTPAWLGARVARTPPQHPAVVTAALYTAFAVLVACWGWLWWRAGRLGARRLATTAAFWALPFAVGPPLVSLDVYSYAAVGRLAATGHDPYAVGPAALGHGAFLAAVDPLWRHTATPYGPWCLLVFRGAAALGHGSVTATVVILRVLAVVATGLAVVAAVRVARPEHRPQVLLLTALNPLVLLHLVSGAHLDAVVGAAVIGAVVLVARGRPEAAMAVAVLAGLWKAPAFLVAGYVLLCAVRRPAAGRSRPAAGARVVATALVVLGVSWLLLPDAFGWVHALGVPARTHDPAPSTWLAALLHGAVGAHLHAATALTVARIVVLAVGCALAAVLLVRGSGRPGTAAGLRAVGWALLAVALSGPVLYGWYLGWSLFPLAAAAAVRGRRALGLLSTALTGMAI